MLDISEKLAKLEKLDRVHRNLEREALQIYRPMQQQLKIHTSRAHELIIRGGKRSGKSTAAALEFARRVTGEPIRGIDGEELDNPWPTPIQGDPSTYWIIGWDQAHIGKTIYRLLFQPGLFRIIKDRETGKWRTWNKSDPSDAARHEESKPVGPAIPSRLIIPDSWVWEKKNDHQFTGLQLTNGAMIYAFWSSSLSPKMGDPVDGIWINEDIQFGSHLKEWQDRLLDRDGWFIWDAWPQMKNVALKSLIDRADEVVDDPDPDIEMVQLIAHENIYHTDGAIRRQLNRQGSDEEIASRDRGELLWDAFSMYDYFPAHHLLRRREAMLSKEQIVTPRDLIENILTATGRLPMEWTRYLSVDPSHTRTGVLSGVVPPPEWHGIKLPPILIIEWELVAKKFLAPQLAEALLPKMQGFAYEAFIMDQNAGRQHTIGADRPTFEVYASAFRDKGLVSRITGSGFVPGVNKPQLRYMMVRQQLELGNYMPGLVLVETDTRETQREFHTYTKKANDVRGEMDPFAKICDEPDNPRKHDLMASLEYLVSYLHPLFKSGTAYVPPMPTVSMGSAAYQAAMALLAKQGRQGNYVHLGPGAAA